MNDFVREVLADKLLYIDQQVKWAQEAAMVAKQNLHGREQELTDLHRRRKAILQHLQEN